MTDCWKSTLRECVKNTVNKVQIANQANLALLKEVDQIDKDADSALIFDTLRLSEQVRPVSTGMDF